MLLVQDIESIEDHRVDANKSYELTDIIFLTIVAVIFMISLLTYSR